MIGPSARASKSSLLQRKMLARVDPSAEANLLEAHPILVEGRGETHQDSLDCVQGLIALSIAWDRTGPGEGYGARAAEWKAKSRSCEVSTIRNFMSLSLRHRRLRTRDFPGSAATPPKVAPTGATGKGNYYSEREGKQVVSTGGRARPARRGIPATTKASALQ